MPAGFVGSDAEEAALGWLETLGYTIRHGPEIAFGIDGGERSDPGYRDTILQNRLHSADPAESRFATDRGRGGLPQTAAGRGAEHAGPSRVLVDGEEFGLTEDKLAPYNALETNDSAVRVLGEANLEDDRARAGRYRAQEHHDRLDLARKRPCTDARARKANLAEIRLPARQAGKTNPDGAGAGGLLSETWAVAA
jgi:hypothetical protein